MGTSIAKQKKVALLVLVMGAYLHVESCDRDTSSSCAADVSDVLQTKVKVLNLETEVATEKVVLSKVQQKAELCADARANIVNKPVVLSEVFSDRPANTEAIASCSEEADHSVFMQSHLKSHQEPAFVWLDTMRKIRAGACLGSYQLLPASILILLMCLALWALARRVRHCEVAEAARSVACFHQFVGLANFSAAFVDSFQLTKAMGHSASASGRLIGIYMLGTAVGGIFMWIALKWRLQIWKEWPRQILIIVQISNFISFIVSLWVTSCLTKGISITWKGQAYKAISFCRFTSGIGHGVGAQLLQVSFAYLTPEQECPQQMARFFFVNTLGIGLGPILVGAMQVLDFCTPGKGRFELSGVVQCVLAGSSLIGITALYPDLQAFELAGSPRYPFRSVSENLSEVSEEKLRNRCIRVWGCLLMGLLRAQVTSGVESASSYLLENHYKWDRNEIGICIGLTFLCCIPAKMALDHEVKVSVFCKIRIMSLISIVGALLLYRAGPVLLLCADIFLFPSLYLSDGLSRGLMQQYALPIGSLLDQNHTTLWAGILSNGVGRYVGPWLSRLIIEKAGQPAYCLMQVVLSLSFLIVFEALVADFDLVKNLYSGEEKLDKLCEEPAIVATIEEPAPAAEKYKRVALDPQCETISDGQRSCSIS